MNITAHMAGDLKLTPEWRKRDWMLSGEFCIRKHGKNIKKTKANCDGEGDLGTGGGTPARPHPHPWGTWRSLCLGV